MTETQHAGTDPRNPAAIHYQGTDGNAACGMAARFLDGQSHRAVSFNDGDEDATCTQCIAYAEGVIADAARPSLERATTRAQERLAADIAFLADAVEAGEPLSGPLARTLLVGASRLAAALAARV